VVHISNNLEQHVEEKVTSNMLICGVDVYRTRQVASEDKVTLDETRQLTEFKLKDLYFSSRHYRLIDLQRPDTYSPASDLVELRELLHSAGGRVFNVLERGILEESDFSTAYVLTPLKYDELQVVAQQ